MPRPLIMALGAAGALAAAGTGVFLSRDKTIPAEQARAPQTVCVNNNIRLVEGMTGDCYSPAQFAAMRDRAVLGADGAPAVVTLTSGDGPAETVANTCAEYDALIAQGAFAMTSAAMRREEFFKRACGALSMLAEASPAQSTHFTGGKAGKADIRSMMDEEAVAFGATAPSAPVAVEEVEDGVWKGAIGAGETTVFEIAHADFTGDGLGEILAYISIGAEGGTARAGAVGLIEKPSASGPCSFTAA